MKLRPEYPVTVLCQVLNYPRSQVYYQPEVTEAEDDLKRLIQELAGQYPTYGYRRMTQELQRLGQLINHKRVARLMKQLGLMSKPPRKRQRTTNSCHEYPRYPNRVLNLTIERPDHVWVGDISVPQQRRERWESVLPPSAYRSRLQTTISGIGA
jgi:putative transposase